MILAELWAMPESYFANPVWLLAALAGLGFVVGMLTGIFGVGGGFLVTPLMIALLGLPGQQAIGSGLCFIIGGSATGLRRHVRLGNYEPRTMLILAIGAIVGSSMGTGVNEMLKRWSGPEQFDLVIQLLYLPMLLTTAWLVWRGPKRDEHGRCPMQKLSLPPRIDLPKAGLTNMSLPGMVGLGVSVGLLTGVLGTGGGVLFVPVLLLVVGLTPHQAVGTSLGVVLPGAATAAIGQGLLGNVRMVVVLALLVTSICGIQLGTWICDRLHATKLRKYFAGIVLLAAAVVSAKLGLKLLSH